MILINEWFVSYQLGEGQGGGLTSSPQINSEYFPKNLILVYTSILSAWVLTKLHPPEGTYCFIKVVICRANVSNLKN